MSRRLPAIHNVSSSLLPFPLSLFLLLFLSGCNVLQLGQGLKIDSDDWTTAGGSSARTHGADSDLAPPLEQAWRYDADAAFGPAAALAADGVLIVTNKKGDVHAISVESGRKMGVSNVKQPITGSPVLTSCCLYAPIADGKRTIVAYDFEEGVRKWALRVGPHEAGLLLDANTLVAASLDGTVRGIDRRQGDVRWSTTPDSAAGFYAAPVAVASGSAVVADDRGRLTRFDLASGETIWSREINLPVYETPASADGRIFVPTTRGQLVALDAATGESVWMLEAGGATVRFSAPAVRGGLVVVGSSDGYLRAVDAETGDLRWSFRSDGNFAAAPLLTEATVYAGAMDKNLYALDLDSGEVLWQHELDGRVKSEPILHDGHLIVLAESKYVYAFTAPSPVASTSSP